MGESEYDLQALTRRLISTRKQWSAGDLADAVLAATPRRALRAAYRIALGAYVRQALGNATDSRPGHGGADTQRSDAGAGTNSDAGDQLSLGAQPVPVPSVGNHLPRSRASLFRASGFREIIHTAPGVYKALAESSAEELLFAAAESDRHAESNAAAAERYRKLVKIMREHDAQTPADLPEDVIAEEFGA